MRPPIALEAKGGVAAAPPPAGSPIPEPPLLSSVEPKPPNLRLGLMTIILCAVVVVVFSGIGYRTYQRLRAGPAKPAPLPVAVTKVPPPAAKPAPAAPTTPQGRAIQKARDVVAAVAANRTAPTNEVTGSTPRSPAPKSTARLFLGGVTYKPGDVIDEGLGIVFVSVDVTTQEVVFKDGTGAIVRRRY